MKRRWIRVLLAVLVIAAALYGADIWRDSIARGRREQFYQSRLQAYRTVLQSASNRSQVEAYLKEHGNYFERWCCFDNEASADSDLVFIGDDPKPWYCSENRVYIAFTFGSSEGPHPRYATDSLDDQLTGIRIFHMLGGCL